MLRDQALDVCFCFQPCNGGIHTLLKGDMLFRSLDHAGQEILKAIVYGLLDLGEAFFGSDGFFPFSQRFLQSRNFFFNDRDLPIRFAWKISWPEFFAVAECRYLGLLLRYLI